MWQQMCVYTQLAYIAVFFQQSYHLLHIRMTINAYRMSYYFSEVLVSIVLNDCPSASGIQAQVYPRTCCNNVLLVQSVFWVN